jgi:hypothetical protein
VKISLTSAVLLLSIFEFVNSRKEPAESNAVEPKGQIKEFASIDTLKERSWGFYKKAEPDITRTLDFRTDPIEFHDGPVNYFVRSPKIECKARECTILENNKVIFSLKFVSGDIFEITTPWKLPEKTVGMHAYGGTILEKGEKYKAF